jgi:hypothetical protein
VDVPALAVTQKPEGMELHDVKAAGLSGVCTERANNGTTSRAALPRP